MECCRQRPGDILQANNAGRCCLIYWIFSHIRAHINPTNSGKPSAAVARTATCQLDGAKGLLAAGNLVLVLRRADTKRCKGTPQRDATSSGAFAGTVHLVMATPDFGLMHASTTMYRPFSLPNRFSSKRGRKITGNSLFRCGSPGYRPRDAAAFPRPRPAATLPGPGRTTCSHRPLYQPIPDIMHAVFANQRARLPRPDLQRAARICT
jgi:hypothetical protein